MYLSGFLFLWQSVSEHRMVLSININNVLNINQEVTSTSTTRSISDLTFCILDKKLNFIILFFLLMMIELTKKLFEMVILAGDQFLLKTVYTWFETWSHAISHLDRWLLHVSLRKIKIHPRFKVYNISYCVYYFIVLS